MVVYGGTVPVLYVRYKCIGRGCCIFSTVPYTGTKCWARRFKICLSTDLNDKSCEGMEVSRISINYVIHASKWVELMAQNESRALNEFKALKESKALNESRSLNEYGTCH